MDNNKTGQVDKAVESFKKEYVVVGKSHIKTWHAWLGLGVLAGATAAILFVANRQGFEAGKAKAVSISPRNIASKNLNFIDNLALNLSRRGKIDYWVNRFSCNNGKCVSEEGKKQQSFTNISITPPSLYLHDIRALASASGNTAVSKKLFLETIFILDACKKAKAFCAGNFLAIAENKEIASSKNVSKLSVFLKDYKKMQPKGINSRFTKFSRFALLADLTKNKDDIAYAKTLSDELGAASKKTKAAYKINKIKVYSGSCYDALGKTSLFQITGDKSYLTVASDFADKAHLDKNIGKLNKPSIVNRSVFNPGIVCAQFLVSLWRKSGNGVYLNEAKNIAQYLVSHNVDLPEHVLVNGSGAFVRLLSGKRAEVSSLDTLAMANLLLSLPDDANLQVTLSSSDIKNNTLFYIAKADDGGDSDGGDSDSGDSSGDSSGDDSSDSGDTSSDASSDADAGTESGISDDTGIGDEAASSGLGDETGGSVGSEDDQSDTLSDQGALADDELAAQETFAESLSSFMSTHGDIAIETTPGYVNETIANNVNASLNGSVIGESPYEDFAPGLFESLMDKGELWDGSI